MTNLPLDSAGDGQKFIQAIVAVLWVLCLIQINGRSSANPFRPTT